MTKIPVGYEYVMEPVNGNTRGTISLEYNVERKHKKNYLCKKQDKEEIPSDSSLEGLEDLRNDSLENILMYNGSSNNVTEKEKTILWHKIQLKKDQEQRTIQSTMVIVPKKVEQKYTLKLPSSTSSILIVEIISRIRKWKEYIRKQTKMNTAKIKNTRLYLLHENKDHYRSNECTASSLPARRNIRHLNVRRRNIHQKNFPNISLSMQNFS